VSFFSGTCKLAFEAFVSLTFAKAESREDAMKGYVKPIIIAIVAGGGAAYAANETVTMNAVDAHGIGEEIGTLELSDTEAGLRVTPQGSPFNLSILRI
jgi:Cu/Zn superoxide dismutase